MKRILTIVLTIYLFGCNMNRNYYDMPIKKWLENNLNDISSYEPVEFIVIDSSNLFELYPKIQYEFFNFSNTLQRRIDILPQIINTIPDTIIKKDLNKSLLRIKEINNKSESYLDIPLIFDLNNSISEKVNNSTTQKNTLTFTMFESSDYRLKTEKENLEYKLMDFGTSIYTLKNELKNGQYIFHKFRAKNSFGAVILSSMIFKLNKERAVVKIAINI